MEQKGLDMKITLHTIFMGHKSKVVRLRHSALSNAIVPLSVCPCICLSHFWWPLFCTPGLLLRVDSISIVCMYVCVSREVWWLLVYNQWYHYNPQDPLFIIHRIIFPGLSLPPIGWAESVLIIKCYNPQDPNLTVQYCPIVACNWHFWPIEPTEMVQNMWGSWLYLV